MQGICDVHGEVMGDYSIFITNVISDWVIL